MKFKITMKDTDGVYHAGSSRDCRHCEKEIHVLSVDTVLYARLSTVPNAAVERRPDNGGEET